MPLIITWLCPLYLEFPFIILTFPSLLPGHVLYTWNYPSLAWCALHYYLGMLFIPGIALHYLTWPLIPGMLSHTWACPFYLELPILSLACPLLLPMQCPVYLELPFISLTCPLYLDLPIISLACPALLPGHASYTWNWPSLARHALLYYLDMAYITWLFHN
jgi:hypothetical protein